VNRQRPSLSKGWAFSFARPVRGWRHAANLSSMSIAVSAVIRPSRLLRVALICFGAANLGAGLALSTSCCGPFFLPYLLAGHCLLASVMILRAFACSGKTHRLDISGLGQIRLTVQQDIGAAVAQRPLVRLMPGSTVWPQMLLLRLRDEHGALSAVAIFPDCVADGLFRALAVAIRNIAGRNNEFLENNEIL
jgi:toxin CptA